MGRTLATLLTAACVFPLGAALASSADMKPCFTVYMTDSATKSQEAVVTARLRRDPSVVTFRFVSKKAALAELKKEFPDLVASLSSNPLSDSFRIRVRPTLNPRMTARRYLRLHLPGVQNALPASVTQHHPCP